MDDGSSLAIAVYLDGDEMGRGGRPNARLLECANDSGGYERLSTAAAEAMSPRRPDQSPVACPSGCVQPGNAGWTICPVHPSSFMPFSEL